MAIKIMRLKQDPFAQFGKISKGDEIPTKSGTSTRPVDLDYFRFQFTEGNEWLADELANIVGDKPRSLDVILMQVFAQDDPLEAVFPHSMQAWNATRLQSECDAETITRRWDEKAQAYDTQGHKCQMKEDGTCPLQCKWTGRLKVIIPALIPVAGVGYFTFTTHGKRDIEQIAGAIQFMLNRNKPMDSILWQMLRTPATSQYKDDKGVARTREYYPVSLTVKSMDSGIFSNPTTPTAPALPPVIVNDSADYGGAIEYEEAPYYDEELSPTQYPPVQGKADNATLAKVILQDLRQYHRVHSDGVQITDILNTLGFKDLDDLQANWHVKYPDTEKTTKNVVDTFVIKILPF